MPKTTVYTPNVILFRAIIFHTAHFFYAAAIVLLGLLLCPLAFYSNATYRAAIQPIQGTYGYCLALLNYLFVNNEIIVTGDKDWLADYKGKLVVISNHQIYPDWWYLWIFAWFFKHSGDVKIMMVEWLKNVPVFGTGFWIFEFIMMKQKWDKDRKIISKSLKKAKKASLPLFMIIFPEGTLNTPNNREKSEKFAKKSDITEVPKHVILPRSTGLFFCIQSLQPNIEYLVDLTIGYYPLGSEEIAYDTYLIDQMFHAKIHPDKVFIHVRKYAVNDIPGFNTVAGSEGSLVDTEQQEQFNVWLRKIYMEKDDMIKKFFEDGSFKNAPGANEFSKTAFMPFPKLHEILTLIGMYLSLFLTLPLF
ncbi:hypothetical protein HK096_005409, partial [Nowakowskiella sp. JEL0078]